MWMNYLKHCLIQQEEISKHFNMSKPSISQHLKILKSAQMILDEKKDSISGNY